ncbi:MAG TPA: OmpH family outer membrane protein [Flavobacteriales bacterium]|nr:OmpH family outer membrane protein [Flavobacteriales bacterium]
MKNLIYVVAAVLLLGSTTAHAQKIGHVNSQELVTQLPGYKTAEADMKKYKDEMMADYEKMKAKLQQMYDDYKIKGPTMTDVQKKIAEDDIVNYENRIAAFEQEITTNLQKREQMYMEPLIKMVKDAIGKVAKAQNINYVLDTGTLIYQDGGNDLQETVKKELEKMTPGTPGNNAPANNTPGGTKTGGK